MSDNAMRGGPGGGEDSAKSLFASPDSSGDALRAAVQAASSRAIPSSIAERSHAKDEAAAAAAWLLERGAEGCGWSDLAIAAPGKRNWRDPLAAALDAAGIPYRMLLGDPEARPERDADRVQVMTLHAAAEFTFPAVAVVGVGDLPWKRQTLEEVERLLSAVVTGATRALPISYSKRSELAEQLRAA